MEDVNSKLVLIEQKVKKVENVEYSAYAGNSNVSVVNCEKFNFFEPNGDVNH